MPEATLMRHTLSKSSHRRHSMLVKQLCEYTAKLEETNINLQEELIAVDQQHQHLCSLFGKENWKGLYARLVADCTQGSKLPDENTRAFLKREPNHQLMSPQEPDFFSKYYEEPEKRLGKTDQTAGFDARGSEDCESSGLKSATAFSPNLRKCSTPINALSSLNSLLQPSSSSADTHMRAWKYKDCQESPIQSESRVMTRSIRGDTDRYYLDSNDQTLLCQTSKPGHSQILLPTLNEQKISQIFTNSGTEYRKGLEEWQDKKALYQAVNDNHQRSREEKDEFGSDLEEQDETLLLSMENTKLRQKLAALEAMLKGDRARQL